MRLQEESKSNLGVNDPLQVHSIAATTRRNDIHERNDTKAAVELDHLLVIYFLFTAWILYQNYLLLEISPNKIGYKNQR